MANSSLTDGNFFFVKHPLFFSKTIRIMSYVCIVFQLNSVFEVYFGTMLILLLIVSS